MRVLDSSKSLRFRSKTAISKVGNVQLVASAVNACRLEVEDSRGWHLVVPFSGQAIFQGEGRRTALSAGQTALLLPNIRRSTERDISSVVIASFSAVRLQETRASIAGIDPDLAGLNDRICTLDLASQPSLFPAFHQICRMIDATRKQDGLAEILGIDDTIYRWLAAAMAVPNSSPKGDFGCDSHAGKLDVLCDMIRSAHERALTLTEMEAATNLSSRTLQYTFQKRFNCTPMEWQRRERMLQCRQRILEAGQDETITAIAI